MYNFISFSYIFCYFFPLFACRVFITAVAFTFFFLQSSSRNLLSPPRYLVFVFFSVSRCLRSAVVIFPGVARSVTHFSPLISNFPLFSLQLFLRSVIVSCLRFLFACATISLPDTCIPFCAFYWCHLFRLYGLSSTFAFTHYLIFSPSRTFQRQANSSRFYYCFNFSFIFSPSAFPSLYTLLRSFYHLFVLIIFLFSFRLLLCSFVFPWFLFPGSSPFPPTPPRFPLHGSCSLLLPLLLHSSSPLSSRVLAYTRAPLVSPRASIHQRRATWCNFKTTCHLLNTTCFGGSNLTFDLFPLLRTLNTAIRLYQFLSTYFCFLFNPKCVSHLGTFSSSFSSAKVQHYGFSSLICHFIFFYYTG